MNIEFEATLEAPPSNTEVFAAIASILSASGCVLMRQTGGEYGFGDKQTPDVERVTMIWGDEFVYGKTKAMAIARETNTPVLFTAVEAAEVTETIRPADLPAIMELKTAPVMALRPSGEEVAMVEVVTPPPTQPETARSLPTTASNLPLAAMFGLIAFGGALAAGAFVKRIQ